MQNVYTRYPISSLVLYNGVTVMHYALGGIGIMIGYNLGMVATTLGLVYLVFALGQMYILMPLMVCPSCVYYRLDDSLCISGLNVVSRKVAVQGSVKDFSKRGEGLFCHNNLYLAAKIIPLVVMLPALFLNFSWLLLTIFLAVAALLVYRIFVLFPKVACVHCRAKNLCPNAQSMGLAKRTGRQYAPSENTPGE